MKTILLVDDELHALEIVGEILTTFGYKVIPRLDAESALSVIWDGTCIDLVITEYRMPGMNGVEFLTILRKVLPSVPVIIFTGHGSVEIYLKSLSLGVFEYLNKPFKEKELDHIVRSALQRSAAENALPVS
jgi:two-component system C4-dicarboxylate transport response regulator DctD